MEEKGERERENEWTFLVERKVGVESKGLRRKSGNPGSESPAGT